MTSYIGNICGESTAKGVKAHGNYTINMIIVALKLMCDVDWSECYD